MLKRERGPALFGSPPGGEVWGKLFKIGGGRGGGGGKKNPTFKDFEYKKKFKIGGGDRKKIVILTFYLAPTFLKRRGAFPKKGLA